LAKVWLSMFVVAVLSASELRADNVKGTVHNQTTKTPAAGDVVILLRLGNGMEEEARTKTDAQGAFSLAGQSAGAAYVVRVLHEGVNYDQTVMGTAPLEINVFDVVSKIKGLSGGIGMAQMESDGKILKVTEMYAITNSSNPPRTQSGPHNFEISLPEKSALDLVEARRSEGVWIKTPPVAMPGQPGRYAINFPIRPGDTLFKYTYHLPYSGPTRFHLRLPYPIQKFAVMHPPSISFRPLQQGAFVNPGMTNGLEIEKVVNEPLMGNVPAFEVSGVGLASAPPAIAQTAPDPQVSAPPVPTSVPPGNRRGGLATTSESPKKTLWLLLAVGCSILAAGVLAVWKMRRERAPLSKPPSRRQALIEVLKEELFRLELDRAQGSISPDDYAATKQALSHSLQRAMAKKAEADC
jgi:hypothetical protein